MSSENATTANYDPLVQLITDALCEDAWEGHDEKLTLADIERMADVAARAIVTADGDGTAADRDALASAIESSGGLPAHPSDQINWWNARVIADAVLAHLGARPAPGTLAADAQALVDEWEAEYHRRDTGDWTSDFSGITYWKCAQALRALIPGRPDASPEDGNK